MTQTISPLDAAEALGLAAFTLANVMRAEAAQSLKSLANDIERGNISDRGDVDKDEYRRVTDEAWRMVEIAKVCDAEWMREA